MLAETGCGVSDQSDESGAYAEALLSRDDVAEVLRRWDTMFDQGAPGALTIHSALVTALRTMDRVAEDVAEAYRNGHNAGFVAGIRHVTEPAESAPSPEAQP